MTLRLIITSVASMILCLSATSCGDNNSNLEPESPVVPVEPETPDVEVESKAGLIHISNQNEYTAENHIFMLDWGEPDSIIFSSERVFDPRYPVQVEIDSEQRLHLKAFSPRRFLNMKIWAGVNGYPEKFLLAQFDTIPPFLEFREKLPFLDKDREYTTETGKTILLLENPRISNMDMAFQIECDDPYYKKFSEIKTTWTVGFSRFDYLNNNYWKYIMKTGHCREAVAMTINSAYMFSSQEYEDEMKKYNGTFYSNGSGYGPNEKNGPLIEDNTVLITAALSHYNGINWGHVSGVGGLGGGKTLGLTDDAYVQHYGDDAGGCLAWFHEFGHGMNYGDSNNTVISNDGSADVISWRKVCQALYVKMCVEKKLPIYSRRFMHSRRNYDFYSSTNEAWKNYAASTTNVIEDPELDELDGGNR